MSKARIVILTLLVFVIIFVVILVPSLIVVVNAGEVGVVDTFGTVSDTPMVSGLNIKSPFATVIMLPTRTLEYTMSISPSEGTQKGDDSVEARASDGALVYIDITVYYHIKPSAAPAIYKDIGLDYEEKIVRPEVRSVIRQEAAKYAVNDIYATKRDELAQCIKDALKTQLEPRGFELEDSLLRNVTLSDTLSQSIEDKLTAQQDAEKLDFLLDREKKEAERKVIEATGQRDAQALINQSLTDRYLYYLYITNLAGKAGTVYVPTEGGLPLFKNVNP